LSEQRLLDALPWEEVKLGPLSKDVKADKKAVLEVCSRLEKKGFIRMRKPLFRDHRILKLKAKFEEGTRVIAVMNLKGGVGKTVTSLNLAASLASLGHKTLLVDLDPQANASTCLNIRGKNTVYSLLVGTKVPSKTVHKTDYENLDVIPSELNLAGAEVEMTGVDSAYRLWEALEWIKDGYEYIVIDCPASLSILSINALTAADSIIVPVQCDAFALESLDMLMETVSLVRKVNEGLHIEGILLTMYDPMNEVAVETARNVRSVFGSFIYDAVVKREQALGEATYKGMPVIHYSKDCDASKAYMKLATEVMGSGG